MNKDQIIQSANLLKQPSSKAQEEYESKKGLLVDEVNKSLSERDDIDILIGSNGMPMMKDNHRNHARFMSNLFKDYSGEVLVDTFIWVLKAYKSHGFNETYWSAQLNSWLDALKENLEEQSFSEISPIYDWILNYQGELQECQKS